MRVPILILTLSISSVIVCGQKKAETRISKFDMVLQGSIESNEGSIILNDGKELTGLVAYNDKTGILKFENGNDSRSLTARSVLGFEVYDPNFDGNRMFYSLQREDQENGSMQPAFFELINDFRFFAVLSRKEPLSLKEKKGIKAVNINPVTNNRSTTQWTKDKIVVQQIETIYLLKPQEDPKPYFSIITEINDGRSVFSKDQKTDEKFVDRNLLVDYMGSLFERVKSYADENKLSFKNKSEFLKILEYYETLLN